MSDELYLERELVGSVLFFKQPDFHLCREACDGHRLEHRFFVSSNVERVRMDSRELNDCVRRFREHDVVSLRLRFGLYLERNFVRGHRAGGTDRECRSRPLRCRYVDPYRNSARQQYGRLVRSRIRMIPARFGDQHVFPLGIRDYRLLCRIPKPHYRYEKCQPYAPDRYGRRGTGGRNRDLGRR